MHRFLFVFLAVAPVAVAQDAPLPSTEDVPENAVIPKEDKVDFTDPVNVAGQILKPGAIRVANTVHKGFAPMIHIRGDFDAEMKESVNEVR